MFNPELIIILSGMLVNERITGLSGEALARKLKFLGKGVQDKALLNRIRHEVVLRRMSQEI
jgi:hypothetical protein